jgi:hypothetical protein
MSLPAHVAVEVNFNVEIDAKGEIVLFGEAAPTVENVIVATHTLPVTALYEADVSGDKFGLIEIWEPSTAQGNIRCQLANDGGSDVSATDLSGVYQTAAARLADGFERLLCDEFDCSGVAPYIESKYAGIEEYQTQRDFGRVMLGVYAHYLFGHVDATAAITNDKVFVESMLSCSAGGDDERDISGAIVRYNSWTAPTGDVETWNFTADNTAPDMDAKLAVRLVEAIVKKGKAGGDISGNIETSDISGGAAPAGSIAQIVRQVIGQDSSRANNVDGSARTLDKHLLLRFYANDVIYVNIKVKKPYITVSGAPGYTGSPNAPTMTDGAADLVTEVSGGYTLKITLA